MKRKVASLVTISRVPFRCQVCQSELFHDKRVRLEVAATFSGFEWCTGLVCARCGYVHLFMNDSVEMWKADAGYPQG